MHRRACAGHRGEGGVGEVVDHSTGQAAHTVVLAVRDVEGVGAVDRQAGGLQQSLGGGWGGVGRGIAGIRPSAHPQTGHRGHIAAGVNLAHAVVLGVGDVEVAKRVEGDVGRHVQGGGCGNPRVLVVTRPCPCCCRRSARLYPEWSANWPRALNGAKPMNPARRRTKGRGNTAHRRGVVIMEKLRGNNHRSGTSAQTSHRTMSGVPEIAVTPRIFNIIGLA